MHLIQDNLIKFRDEIFAFHIPRWNELPELELYMDQLVTFIEDHFSIFVNNTVENIITPSMVNNYVKLDLIPKPVNKRYNRVHLAHLIVITILKHVFTIQQIRDGIISQSKLTGEKDAYNSFCEEQENALKFLINKVPLLEEIPVISEEINFNNLIMKFGTLTFASKIITAKMIHLQNQISD